MTIQYAFYDDEDLTFDSNYAFSTKIPCYEKYFSLNYVRKISLAISSHILVQQNLALLQLRSSIVSVF